MDERGWCCWCSKGGEVCWDVEVADDSIELLQRYHRVLEASPLRTLPLLLRPKRTHRLSSDPREEEEEGELELSVVEEVDDSLLLLLDEEELWVLVEVIKVLVLLRRWLLKLFGRSVEGLPRRS